jgi:hypothetical protein
MRTQMETNAHLWRGVLSKRRVETMRYLDAKLASQLQADWLQHLFNNGLEPPNPTDFDFDS